MRTLKTLVTAIAALSLILTATGCDKDKPAAEGAAKAAAGDNQEGGDKAGEAKKASGPEGPAEVAKKVIAAFKAKDAEALAALVPEKHREEIAKEAAEMFASDKANIVALRDWDGKTLDVRYKGDEAQVVYGPADGRLAVLEMKKGEGGRWLSNGIRYTSKADFEAWGSTTPGAAK